MTHEAEGRPGAGSSTTALLHALNDGIASVATEFEQTDEPSPVWAFHCECGVDGCREWVELGLEDYSEIRGVEGQSILAPGHSVDQAKRAREQAASLREESRALKAQARHQVRRADRASVGKAATRYRYVIRAGGGIVATGHVNLQGAVEPGDRIELCGLSGIVRAVEPVAGELERRLVVDADGE